MYPHYEWIEVLNCICRVLNFELVYLTVPELMRVVEVYSNGNM